METIKEIEAEIKELQHRGWEFKTLQGKLQTLEKVVELIDEDFLNVPSDYSNDDVTTVLTILKRRIKG